MVRQYKIHTNLDGADDKVWDMTNGDIRLYLPSDFGLEIENNIFTSAGIGVVGTKIISQPDIEFNLETFCLTLADNYKILNEFVNDCLAQKFVTLEYQTENFQVYADLALKKVTKTEGYGNNGQFSEKITFSVITKWYTYENLSFNMIENGEIINGKSKIYGGYKGSETALQNYNRLKASSSLNLPNLNLLTDTKDFENKNVSESQAVTSITSPYSVAMTENDTTFLRFSRVAGGIQDWFKAYLSRGTTSPSFPKITIKGNTQYTFSVYLRGSGTHTIIAYDSWTNPINAGKSVTLTNDWKLYTFTVLSRPTADLPADKTVQFFIRSSTEGDVIDVKEPKIEEGAQATGYFPASSEITIDDISEYFGYNYIQNQAYTYYGEMDISRLSRWDIKDEIFSVVARLDPTTVNGESGVRFLDTNGTEYTALIFNPRQVQDYILINTDVNDEFYQGWRGTTTINLFPVMDFQRFRTRIIQKGQMLLVNLRGAEFKIKRKADFM